MRIKSWFYAILIFKFYEANVISISAVCPLTNHMVSFYTNHQGWLWGQDHCLCILGLNHNLLHNIHWSPNKYIYYENGNLVELCNVNTIQQHYAIVKSIRRYIFQCESTVKSIFFLLKKWHLGNIALNKDFNTHFIFSCDCFSKGLSMRK